MKLTDTQIRHAKPREKQYKLTDGQGMYLLVKPNGSKLWRLEFSLNKKRNTLAIGKYPAIKLKDARKLLADAKERAQNNIPILIILEELHGNSILVNAHQIQSALFL